MKTKYVRVMMAGVVLSSLMLCAGCEEEAMWAEVPQYSQTEPPAAADPLPVMPVVATSNTPLIELQPVAIPNPPPLAAIPATNVAAVPWTLAATNPASSNASLPNLPVPANVKLSPALTEITRMAQAGIRDDVMLAYITNSTNLYYVGADEIVYLNDLGISSSVITAMIQMDALPENVARKQGVGSAKPLPPNLVLTTPATNIYPTQTAPPAAPEMTEAPAPVPQYVTQPPATTTVITQPAEVTYFYDSLAPYGNWIEVPDYGVCWQPTVAVVNSSWRPYADNGRWLWTDSGWYWHSYYSWGWAPFHYGRWASHPGYGWIWTPDTYWGPSWVTWRHTPYYCGWAPLPPRCHYVSGFGLYYANSSVGIGFGFGFGADYYTFIPWGNFCDRNPHHYYANRGHAKTIYKDSTIINNYIVGNNNTIINHGVGLDRVSRMSRAEIPKYSVREEVVRTGQAVRPERLENDNGRSVVVRPRLPEPAAMSAANATAPRGGQPARPANASVARLAPAADTPATTPARPGSATAPARPERPNVASTPRATAPAASTVVTPNRPTGSEVSKTAPSARTSPGNTRFVSPRLTDSRSSPLGVVVTDNRAAEAPVAARAPEVSKVESPVQSPAPSASVTTPARPASGSRLAVPTAPARPSAPPSASRSSLTTTPRAAPPLTSRPSVPTPAAAPKPVYAPSASGTSARGEAAKPSSGPVITSRPSATRSEVRSTPAPTVAPRQSAPVSRPSYSSPSRPQSAPAAMPSAPAYRLTPSYSPPSRSESVRSTPAAPSRSSPPAAAPSRPSSSPSSGSSGRPSGGSGKSK